MSTYFVEDMQPLMQYQFLFNRLIDKTTLLSKCSIENFSVILVYFVIGKNLDSVVKLEHASVFRNKGNFSKK